MAVELGQSADPRALVPGAPQEIEAEAAALAAHARRADQVGTGLKRIDVGDWRGPAGSGFLAAFTAQPPKWLTMADSIGTASRAMTGYAQTLRWAQEQAATAAEMWRRGTAATAEARAAVAATEPSGAAATGAGDPGPGAPGSGAGVAGAPGGGIVDPGEALRREAQAVLDRARAQLRAAGDLAARAVAGGRLGAPLVPGPTRGGPGALGSLVDAVTRGWTGQGGVERNRPGIGVEGATFGRDGKLAELTAYARLGGAEIGGHVGHGIVDVGGKAGFDIGARGAASVSLTSRDGLRAGLEGSVGAEGSAEGRVRAGAIGVYGRAELNAGASAEATLGIGTRQTGLDLGAFAGTKAGLAGGVELGGVSVGLQGDVRAGVGAGAGFGWNRTPDGVYHLGPHVDLTLGLGAGGGFEVAVDPKEIQHTVDAAAGAVGHGVHDVGHLGMVVERGLLDGLDRDVGAVARRLDPLA